MPESAEIPVLCSCCETEMIQGCLKVPIDRVYIESSQSREGSLLHALVCPVCGHVELQAIHPENLIDHDISDEELDALPGKSS